MISAEQSEQAINDRVGANIKSLRKSRNISLAELAKEIGVGYQILQKYETSEVGINVARLYKLAKYFNINIAYFFGGLDSYDNSVRPSNKYYEDVLSND